MLESALNERTFSLWSRSVIELAPEQKDFEAHVYDEKS